MYFPEVHLELRFFRCVLSRAQRGGGGGVGVRVVISRGLFIVKMTNPGESWNICKVIYIYFLVQLNIVF